VRDIMVVSRRVVGAWINMEALGIHDAALRNRLKFLMDKMYYLADECDLPVARYDVESLPEIESWKAVD